MTTIFIQHYTLHIFWDNIMYCALRMPPYDFMYMCIYGGPQYCTIAVIVAYTLVPGARWREQWDGMKRLTHAKCGISPKYARELAVSFALVYHQLMMESHDLFTHIRQCCFNRFPWNTPEGHEQNKMTPKKTGAEPCANHVHTSCDVLHEEMQWFRRTHITD